MEALSSRQAFDLNWTYGAYHRTTFALNPLNEVAARNSSLANTYSMKTLHLGGISPQMAMYKPYEESRLESLIVASVEIKNTLEAPAVCTRVGKGYLGFLGDVNGEICSTNTLVAMLGSVDTANIPLAPPELPTTTIRRGEYRKGFMQLWVIAISQIVHSHCHSRRRRGIPSYP